MRKLAAFQALLGTILLVSSFSIFIRPALAIPYANVSVQQGKAMIDSNPSVAILDLRNQSEYDSGHIGNARLIPVWNLTQNLDKFNKSDTILVYCNQDNRSTDASEILVSNGFSNICNMIGGIDAWALAGYPEYVKYSSIQEAIDDATEGSTIFISIGYYFEHLTINKSITLVGENRYATMIAGNNSGTILSIASDNVSITDLTVEWACACHGSYGTLIEPNHSGISLIDNEMINDGVAINATFATNLVIAKNNFSSGSDLSMAISNSSNVLITGNNMDGFFQGGEITDSSNLTFSFNIITGTAEGIVLQNSNGSVIRGNQFTQDSSGISLRQSNGNLIYDNDFNNNFKDIASQQSVNQWDDGVEGNFWGNYTGIDANLDGVGDTPYLIDANNTDKHPLAGMFASYDVSNQEVDCMSNSSIKSCNFKINDSTQGVLALSVSAPNGTQGFCRIRLPVELINSSLAVTLDEQIITEPQTHILPSSNENYTLVYISYSPSEHTIEIIGATSVPEWPINLLWITVMLTTLLASAAIGKICLPRRQEENRQAATHSDTSEF
jgi:parallel beta-helix repeat protein